MLSVVFVAAASFSAVSGKHSRPVRAILNCPLGLFLNTEPILADVDDAVSCTSHLRSDGA